MTRPPTQKQCDIQIYQEIITSWQERFKVTLPNLKKVLLYCFGIDLQEYKLKLLEMPAFVLKDFEWELEKAVNRMRDKMNTVDKLLKRRKKTKIEFYETEAELSGFNLFKENGVWRRKYQ